MNQPITSRLAVLALAIGALIFGTGAGCDVGDSEPSYLIRCEGDKLQAYQIANPNGGLVLTIPVNNPINGMDCSVSTELQGRPLSLSEAIQHGIAPGDAFKPLSLLQASARPVSLIDTYANLVPLPFGPLVSMLTGTCTANLSSYLVNHTNGTVTDVALCSMSVIKTIQVGSHPLQVAITPDGSTALVTRYDGAVVWIDTNTDQVTFTLSTPGSYPSGIGISPDGTRAYVTSYIDVNPSLLVIDLAARAIVSAIPLPQAYPRSVAVTPDGSQVWVNYLNTNFFDIIDTLSLTQTWRVGLGGEVSTGMAFNPTGTKAFIATGPNLLTVVDTQTLNTLAKVQVGTTPIDVALSQDGRRVFVNSYNSGVIAVIDSATNKLIQNLQVNSGGMGLTVVPAGLK